MKGKYLITLFSAFLFFGVSAKGQTEPVLPYFSNLGSETHNMAVSMSCKDNRSPNSILCTFVRMELSDKSKDELKEAISQARKMAEGLNEKDANEFIKDSCSTLNRKSELKFYDKEIPYLVKQMMHDYCKCGSKSDLPSKRTCISDALEASHRKLTECVVTGSTWTIEMKKVGGGKWIGRDSARCVEEVSTVEYSKKKGQEHWNYSVNRKIISKEKLCQDYTEILEPTYRFSSDVEPGQVVGCTVIKLNAR